MQLIVLVFAGAVFLVVTALLSAYGQEADAREKRIRDVKTAATGEIRKHGFQPGEKLAKIKQARAKKARAKRAEKKNGARNKKEAEVDRQLELAGINLTAGQFSRLKLVIAAVLLVVVFLLSVSMGFTSDTLLLCCAAALAGGLVLPGQLLKSKITKKQNEFRNELPDLMDLLAVSVEAGMGFDAAMTRLYEKNKTSLMEELMCAQRDIHHGISRKNAYAAVSARCGVKELTGFLNAMVQAEELGVSIRSVLRTQSETIREERRRRAEEKALKAPVTMLIPMVIFIFPVIFIVLLGPAVMNIMEVL